ncbi:hypothetical protein ABB37_07652 [Leptomonas pyrrhocoris]|uniref:Uncharacterized protein n=1 Tax=Leptomonas pyrrhocoris TaxID=157538 RepID=A0A0M9FVE0_LEPPY|nr:hypothetical protein ABB37_07652 [Leptomonas pyrrhocoris]KPA76855.1 hypothetical protein ABB37_07652 [Leptomonas pyrrhocoris]|eukprot:XP_015655294.1 hypothetical protein ABB37_07652 [Leptomonas pyrrhocoris]
MTVSSPPAFELPQRGLFDVVAASDTATLLTLVRGDNPFDVSPGMELIRQKKRSALQPYAENALVMASADVKIDVAQIPRTRDCRGNGAAHVAAAYGLSSMLGVLVKECGCSVDECNEMGFTPLHAAALHGHVDCVRLLCDLGASLLCPTRIVALAGAGEEAFFGGRTALFLAHYAQQTAVLAFLTPFYAEFIKSFSDGKSAAEVWGNAATLQNTQMLSLLLDAVECVDGLTGLPLLAVEFDVEAGLREALPAVLAASLPEDQRITPEQHFVLRRLVRLGYINAATPFSASASVLDRILSTAQVGAWRVLVEEGVVVPQTCEVEAVRSCGYNGNGEEELRLLISEARAHARYRKAKRNYERKGDNNARRKALLSTREAWKALQSQMRADGVSPAEVRQQL